MLVAFMVFYRYVKISKNPKIYNQSKAKNGFKAKPVLIVALVLVTVGLAAAYLRHHNQKPSVSSGPTAAEIKQTSDINAKKKEDSITNNADTGTKEPGTAPTTTAPTTTTVGITSKQETNGSVTITTKLEGVSAGNCTLSITNGSKTETRSAAVIFQPQFSTCAGFSVPTTNLGTGIWNITVTVVQNGISSSNTSTLEVN